MVEAETPDDAMAALEQTSSQNYMGKTDKNGVPEGMVFDPATNRMVDAKALADNIDKEGSWAGSTMKGMPFVGEFADELAGYLTSSNDTKNNPNQSQPIQTEVARQLQSSYEEQNPKTALASKIGLGLTAAPAALAALPAVPATWGLLGRTAATSALGGVTGATEGFVSGYGEGKDDTRLDTAKDRSLWSGATGAVIGAAQPIVTDAISAGTRKVMDHFTVDKAVKDLGMSRPSADAAKSVLEADDALGPTGLARLRAAGDDAMLADAGQSTSGMLDTVIQKSGKAGNLAQAAVEKRAADANIKLRGTMDMVLGKPVGVDEASRKIAQRTAAIRKAAYDAAYSKPIDYASDAGRTVEDVFNRTPPDILNAALKKANNKMVIDGMKNMQIMADIADDGTVSFRQMPNVMQVDYLKRALNQVADDSMSIRGAMSGEGADAAKLAKQLRDAAMEAVPDYKSAVKLGGDNIEEKKALELGYSLLNPSVTRENVSDAAKGMTDAERKQAALGLRQYVDDMTANVEQAMKDTNMDAREAAKELRKFSSRAAKEKVVEVLGEQKARPLFAQLEKAQAALSLKAEVVANSRTFARTEMQKSVEDRGKDSMLWAIRKGEPVEASKRAWQMFTGATANDIQANNSKIYEDIATLLTGPRGQAAQLALQRLEQAYKTGNLNKETARQVGKILYGSAVLPTYQLSTQ